MTFMKKWWEISRHHHQKRRVFQEFCGPWEDATLIELLTKIIGYGILKEKLKKIWILNSGFDIKDVSKRFYTLKFDQQEEKDKVITGGLLDDFLPSLDKQKLDPMFISLMAQVEHTLFPSSYDLCNRTVNNSLCQYITGQIPEVC
ncbi:hypothetical protein HKD37_15G042672 [Glycine soja]